MSVVFQEVNRKLLMLGLHLSLFLLALEGQGVLLGRCSPRNPFPTRPLKGFPSPDWPTGLALGKACRLSQRDSAVGKSPALQAEFQIVNRSETLVHQDESAEEFSASLREWHREGTRPASLP